MGGRGAETEWVKYEIRKKEAEDADERLAALKETLRNLHKRLTASLPQNPTVDELAFVALVEFALAATDHCEIGRAISHIERRLNGPRGIIEPQDTGEHAAAIPIEIREMMPEALDG